jgi:glycosyltransferase involved in cell wall biosynthesis
MAAGCAIVASDTAPVHEFIAHGKTGLLADMLQPEAVAEAVLRILRDQKLNQRLRRNARAWAEKHLDMGRYIAAFEALISKAIKGGADGRVG